MKEFIAGIIDRGSDQQEEVEGEGEGEEGRERRVPRNESSSALIS